MTERSFGGPFVITGLSGSGKTVLSRSLEDIGYLCVDNIPLDLLSSLFDTTDNDAERLAVVLDVRAKGMAEKFPAIFLNLKLRYPTVRLIFVEASPAGSVAPLFGRPTSPSAAGRRHRGLHRRRTDLARRSA